MEWCFACCHFYNSAPQRPDISWFPITSRSLVYNLWGHILESSCEIKMCHTIAVGVNLELLGTDLTGKGLSAGVDPS